MTQESIISLVIGMVFLIIFGTIYKKHRSWGWLKVIISIVVLWVIIMGSISLGGWIKTF